MADVEPAVPLIRICGRSSAVGAEYGQAEIQGKKRGPRQMPGPFSYEGYLTSRGEQLMRRHWEENRHVHQLSAIWVFFVQGTMYADA